MSVPLSIIEHMFAALEKILGAAESLVASFDPDVVDPKTAVAVMEMFSRGEKIMAAGKALAAKRVDESGVWREEGAKSAPHFVAGKTGEQIGKAVETIETAKRLEDLPKVDEAFRSGELSHTQAFEVASAASVVPQAEEQLLELASTRGVATLKEECRRVAASACPDEAERDERLHRARSLRTWTDPEGAWHLKAQLPPQTGAEVAAVLERSP